MSTEWIGGLLVKQLQEELKKRQLPVSGKKAELQERLVAAVLDEEKDGHGPPAAEQKGPTDAREGVEAQGASEEQGVQQEAEEGGQGSGSSPASQGVGAGGSQGPDGNAQPAMTAADPAEGRAVPVVDKPEEATADDSQAATAAVATAVTPQVADKEPVEGSTPAAHVDMAGGDSGAVLAASSPPAATPPVPAPMAAERQASNITPGASAAMTPSAAPAPVLDAVIDPLLAEEPLDYGEPEATVVQLAEPAAVPSYQLAANSTPPASAAPLAARRNRSERHEEAHVDTPHPGTRQGKAAAAKEREHGAAGHPVKDATSRKAQGSGPFKASGTKAPASEPRTAASGVADATSSGGDAAARKRKHAPIPDFAPRDAAAELDSSAADVKGVPDAKAVAKGSSSKGAAADARVPAKQAKESAAGGPVVAGSKRQAPAELNGGDSKRVATAVATTSGKPDPKAAAATPATVAATPATTVDTLAPDESGGTERSGLLIENFVRPFTERALRELLGKTGTVVDLWLASLKTHCYVLFENEAQAAATFAAVNGLQWPPASQKRLAPTHLTAGGATTAIANARAGGGGPARPIAARLSGQAGGSAALAAAATASAADVPLPLSGRTSEAHEAPVPWAAAGTAPPAAAATSVPPAVHQEAVLDLNQLFKCTKTKPCVYWLPLTEAQVTERKDKANATTNTKGAPVLASGDAPAAAIGGGSDRKRGRSDSDRDRPSNRR